MSVSFQGRIIEDLPRHSPIKLPDQLDETSQQSISSSKAGLSAFDEAEIGFQRIGNLTGQTDAR
jgi:hypothetical protein